MEENKNPYTFHLLDLLQVFWRWRVKIIVVTLLAGVLMAVFSGPWFITPKFKSDMIFFPTVNNSFSASFLRENGEKADPLEFGTETQVEEMLQILNSDLMKGEVIRRFDLLHHYNIDTSNKYKYQKLGNIYDHNISFKRTEFTSILCTVQDEDMQMASDIVDGISVIIDSLKTAIQRQVAYQALAMVENSYHEKQQEIKWLNDSLEILAQMGVYNASEQAKTLTDRLSKGGFSQGEIEKQQQLLAKYGRAYETLSRTVFLELEKLSDLKKKYDEAKVDANSSLTHKFVVSKSGRSEIKSYPIRSMMVVVALFSTFLLSLVLIFIFEKIYKPLRQGNAETAKA